MSFELIPAIDLLGGVLRAAVAGPLRRATVYARDPGRAGRALRRLPASRASTSSISTARKAGAPVNARAVRAILAAVPGVPVQLGGGMRTLRRCRRCWRRASTASCSAPSRCAIPSWCARRRARFPGRVAVGIDAQGRPRRRRGWTRGERRRASSELARRFEDAGVAALIHTDIARDGMLEGPNLEASLELADAVSLPVIVSGGVGSAEDVLARRALADARLAGAIVGRALYTGGLDLASTLAQLGSRACC